MTQIIWQNRRNFFQRSLRRCTQALVTPLHHPARTQNKRLNFFRRKHHGRQHEARTQYISKSWLPFNASALFLQGTKVSIESAQTDTQTASKLSTSYRKSVSSQKLDQL